MVRPTHPPEGLVGPSGPQVPGHLQEPQHSALCGRQTPGAFGHCSSEVLFILGSSSVRAEVGESFPRYLEWNLAWGVFAQRATHPISVRLPQLHARLTSAEDWLRSFL